MIRTLMMVCLVSVGGIGLPRSAAAQTGCPPGEAFIDTLNRCVAGAEAARCPAGTRYNADLRRCIGTPGGSGCPAGQSFDAQQKQCVAAPK